MIRRATIADVPALVAMGQQFAESADYRDRLTVDPAQLAALAERALANEDAVVFVAAPAGGDPVGMIAMLLYQHPMSGVPVASEIVWWVNPDHRGSIGVRLLRAAEAWAQARGAAAVHMIAPNPRVGAFYDALGYRVVETTYQKRVA